MDPRRLSLLTDFGFAPPGDLALGYFMGFMTAALLIYAPLRCVLDEPAGSCNSEAEANVRGAGSADARPHGAVIAHRLSTVKKADLICVLDQGRIIESTGMTKWPSAEKALRAGSIALPSPQLKLLDDLCFLTP